MVLDEDKNKKNEGGGVISIVIRQPPKIKRNLTGLFLKIN
jgi:hypothetical protein